MEGVPRTYFGELRGYRWWWYDPEQLCLVSLIRYNVPWKSDSLTAECSFSQFIKSLAPEPGPSCTVPNPDCTCGIYGHYQPADSIEYMSSVGTRRFFRTHIFGAIAASGLIISGTKGFRAEQVRILGLAGSPVSLRQTYPTIPLFSTVKELLIAFPPCEVPV